MRVVGLVSSPRKGGNSELAVQEILRCLPADWEKVMLRLDTLHIESCRACYRCLQEGAKCPIQDDLDWIIRNIKHSDKVVIAFPAYIYTAPGPVKSIMDRLLSVTSDYPTFPGSDCVMVLPYGIAGWEGMIKEDAIILARKLHLRLLEATPILATLPGDSVQGENLETLHRLAGLLKEGKFGGEDRPAPTSEALECPHCSSTVLKIHPSGKVRCAVCGGTAQLTQVQTADAAAADTWTLTVRDTDFAGNFTHASLDEHIRILADKKALFLENVTEIQALQARYAGENLWIEKPEKDGE